MASRISPPGHSHQSPDTLSLRLVFVGAMDYFANVEGARYFAEEVFPLIRSRESQAKFSITSAAPFLPLFSSVRYGTLIASNYN